MKNVDVTLLLAISAFLVSSFFIYKKIFKNEKYKGNNGIALSVVVLGCIMVVFFPIIFSRVKFINSLDFSNTGNIGDTIGGITAPFIGLISAILVYFSFQAQIEANEELRKQILKQDEIRVENEKFDQYNKMIDLIENKIDVLTYNSFEKGEIEGKNAFLNYIETFYTKNNPNEHEVDMNYSSPFFTILVFVKEIINNIAKEKFEVHKFKIIKMRLDLFVDDYLPLEENFEIGDHYFFPPNFNSGLENPRVRDKSKPLLEWWIGIRIAQFKIIQLSNKRTDLDFKSYPYDFQLLKEFYRLFQPIDYDELLEIDKTRVKI